MILFAGLLAVLIGAAHSYLGERYILVRLFQRTDIPKLLGSDWFTKRTLRFAWHITTLAWWGFATVLFALTRPSTDVRSDMLWITGAVFLLSGLLSLGFTRGKHLSWLVFWTIAGLCFGAALRSS